MNDGCIVISYGYDTVGMSKSRGFKKIGVCVVCHNGDHNDTLCLVEQLIATPSYSSEANASSSANAESLIGIKRQSNDCPNLSKAQTSLNSDINRNKGECL